MRMDARARAAVEGRHGRFLTPLRTDWMRPWVAGYDAMKPVELLEPLVYECADGREVTVPAGFPADGASVPGWLACRFPHWSTLAWSGFVHDYLIRQKPIDPCREWRNDYEADLIFAEASHAVGVEVDRVRWMYRGVRLGSYLRAVGLLKRHVSLELEGGGVR